jgi:hypothetical protein
MWAEVILAKDDLGKVMSDFCPLTINLADGGRVVLSSPCELMLVADVGLSMTVTGAVHWPVLGIPIPISVRSATLRVIPEIRETSSGERLRFRLHLADADLSLLPGIVERGLVDLVNKELDADAMAISWNFTKTLSHVFELPDVLASARALALRATWGRVRITSEALVLAVAFEVGVEPRGGSGIRPSTSLDEQQART